MKSWILISIFLSHSALASIQCAAFYGNAPRTRLDLTQQIAIEVDEILKGNTKLTLSEVLSEDGIRQKVLHARREIPQFESKLRQALKDLQPKKAEIQIEKPKIAPLPRKRKITVQGPNYAMVQDLSQQFSRNPIDLYEFQPGFLIGTYHGDQEPDKVKIDPITKKYSRTGTYSLDFQGQYVREFKQLPDGSTIHYKTNPDDTAEIIFYDPIKNDGRKLGGIPLAGDLTHLHPMPNGKVMLVYNQGRIMIYHGPNKLGKMIQLDTRAILNFANLPDGRMVTGQIEGDLRIWKLDANNNYVQESKIPAHSELVSSLAVFPDGRLASSSYDGTVKVWKSIPGSDKLIEDETVRPGHGAVMTVNILPGDQLITSSLDMAIVILEIGPSGKYVEKQTDTNHTNSLRGVLVLSNGDFIIKDAFAQHTNRVQLWSRETKEIEVDMDEDLN